MNPELILIKLLINKDIYNRYISYIDINKIKELYIDIYKILLVIKDTYNNTTNNISINSIQDLKILYNNYYPSLKPSETEATDSLFQSLQDLDISTAVMEKVLEDHKTRYIASKLAEVCWDTSNGQKSLLELRSAFADSLGELDSGVVLDDFEFVSDDIDSLLSKTYTAPGLKWQLKTLRVMMGSLRKGNFGFIYARPESGKTTLLASQGVYFAHQLDRPYLHVNNEESGEAVKLRYIQAATGKTIEQISKNRKQAMDDFLEYTKGNIKMRDVASISWQEIEAICKKLNPGMIVIDSIDKVKGFEDDRDDLRYKKIYQWARELSKMYGPVIGVCHASVSGEGKEWMEMDDVAYAKTAKQSEADWILALGRSYDQGKEYIRSIHLPKNKLMGDEDSIEEFRHGKIRVIIRPDIARYEDIQFKDD